MKYLKTIILMAFTISIYSQYNYGIEVESRDVLIEGKINIDAGNGNTHIGNFAGISDTADGNTFLGSGAGFSSSTGSSNTFIGANAGSNNTSGALNTFIGTSTGGKNSLGERNVYIGEGASASNEGSSNVIIGFRAGLPQSQEDVFYNSNVFIGSSSGGNNNGNNNIFLGYRAGHNADGSNLLFIENSDSNDPLIYGEFNNDLVKINGSFHVKDFLKLEPQNGEPFQCDLINEGAVFYDKMDHKLKVCNGTDWKPMND